MGRPVSATCTKPGSGALVVHVRGAVGPEKLLRLHRGSSDRPAHTPIGLPRGDASRHRSAREEQPRSSYVVATEHTALAATQTLFRVPGGCWPGHVWAGSLK